MYGLLCFHGRDTKLDKFLDKNQYTHRKPLYFENTGSASSSKIGHDFRKESGLKIEVRKKCVLQKMVS